jgi:hypothetical protein
MTPLSITDEINEKWRNYCVIRKHPYKGLTENDSKLCHLSQSDLLVQWHLAKTHLGVCYCYAACHYAECRYAECCGAVQSIGVLPAQLALPLNKINLNFIATFQSANLFPELNASRLKMKQSNLKSLEKGQTAEEA